MKIVFDSNKKIAYKGEVLIGLGNGKNSINKTPQFPSCALYFYNNPIKYENQTIYIEDFSVDTIIPIYMLIKGNISKKYIDYSTHWEKGEEDKKILKSYGVIQGALIASLNDLSITQKVEKSLELLDFFIKNNYDLSNIPYNKHYLYLKAFNKICEEIKNFKNILINSEQYNLFITKTIKTIFIENQSITPIIKLLLRKRFDLIVSFNEKYKGSGNDVVISISPNESFNLKELWINLEKAETKAWNEKRPSNNPRKLIGVNNIYNEPWWNDMGNYTLIAAPKSVEDQEGSKLSYDEIKQIILDTYKKETR